MIQGLIKEFSAKCDYVDARVHEAVNEVLVLENGETSNVFTNNKSIGVRVLFKGGWGMACSYNISKARDLFNKALRIARLTPSPEKSFQPPRSVTADKKYPCEINPFTIEPVEKTKLLKELESRLTADAKVKNVKSILINSRVNKRVLASGIDVNQEFTNNVLKTSVTAREGSVIQSTIDTYSKLGGYEVIKSLSINDLSDELLKRVNRLLSAKAPKPERSTIVCDPRMSGLFFHEAVGHACEADTIINQSSVFQGLKNKTVASKEVNLFDDPGVKERGFYWFDDEGVKATPTKLITKGKLTGFLHSLITAGKLGEKPTGNGRAADAESPPIPRMSNTVLEPGEWSVEELIKEAGNGYLVKGFNGGVVDPVTGQFSFGASECYRITNGVVAEPLRNASLAGNILETLKGIRVGSDAQNTRLASYCGKANQMIRVGKRSPSILIKEAIIGGTA